MNPHHVTLRQLRAFVAVAETGSFAAAARRMHVTPSALSLLVKELERGMAVRVFDRSTRSTTLSTAGGEFYPLARKLLDDLTLALAATQDLAQKKRGTVRIACTPLYASTTLPALIQQYRRLYPAITVYVLDSLNQQALGRVLSGEADLGIAPQRSTPPELVQERLLRDRLWFICPPDHPMAARESVRWAQVLKQPFVSLTPDFTQRLQADLFKHSASLVLQPAHEVSFITTAFGMVQSGHGVTAQPAKSLQLIEPFGLVARPLVAPVIHRELGLFVKRGLTLSPAARSFRDFLLGAMSTA
ncbi:DNA-binding transcriptional regulator, LysR family [Burkholderiales bacterium 8X]|nr:DNA-binding transcriptional regulator, LysR family [Burkholderiales bacterium 8X]